MRPALLAALALVAHQSLAAEVPPVEFKGIKLGSSLRDLRAMPDVRCNDVREMAKKEQPGSVAGSWLSKLPYSDTFCVGLIKAVGARTDFAVVVGVEAKNVGFDTIGERVHRISINLPASAFVTLRDAVMTKYGKPSEVRNERMQNLAGSTFDNAVLTWELSDGIITVEQFRSNIDTTNLSMVSRNYHALVESRRQLQAAENAKGL